MSTYLNISTILSTPSKEPIKVDGEMGYNESAGAWSIIRLKKDILQEYPQLKEKRGKFAYKMIMPKSLEDIGKVVKDFLENTGEVVPIFLFFSRKENN